MTKDDKPEFDLAEGRSLFEELTERAGGKCILCCGKEEVQAMNLNSGQVITCPCPFCLPEEAQDAVDLASMDLEQEN